MGCKAVWGVAAEEALCLFSSRQVHSVPGRVDAQLRVSRVLLLVVSPKDLRLLHSAGR